MLRIRHLLLPVALEVYTQVFDEMNALDKLENFLSVNGPAFFGLEPSSEQMTLVRENWETTDPVTTEDGINLWPICNTKHGLGGEVIRWKILR